MRLPGWKGSAPHRDKGLTWDTLSQDGKANPGAHLRTAQSEDREGNPASHTAPEKDGNSLTKVKLSHSPQPTPALHHVQDLRPGRTKAVQSLTS